MTWPVSLTAWICPGMSILNHFLLCCYLIVTKRYTLLSLICVMSYVPQYYRAYICFAQVIYVVKNYILFHPLV